MNRMKLRSRCNGGKSQSDTHTCLNQILQTCCRRKPLQKRNRRGRVTKKHKSSQIKRITGRKVIEVIKCISGSTSAPGKSTSLHDNLKYSRSQGSVVYVGTYPLNSLNMPHSVIDLTQSDTTLFSPKWESPCTEDNYHISGDNIVDELRIRENTPTRNASIFTIFPPKPHHLFSTPSDELCVCPQEITRKLCKKRNRSMSDVSCESQTKVKRLASSRSRLNGTDAESTDNVWKLKRTYPLNNFISMRKTKSGGSIENLGKMDIDCNLDLMSVSQGFDGQCVDNAHAILAEDLKCLKVTNNTDM